MTPEQLFHLRGQTSVITGGRRGLGRAMALGLAAAGAHIAIVAAHGEPADLREAIEGYGVRLTYRQADLCDRDARAGILADIADETGGIDILVNNAGHQVQHAASDYPLTQWDRDMELMLTAALDLAQQAHPLMLARGGGRIINIASISSFQGARNIVGYATVKHGIVGLTKCLANEWAAQGIRVNAIAPGLFETDMATHVTTNPQQTNELRGRIPAGRFGRPEDIVGPLIFLASDASRHVHGHVLLVDGGWMGR